MERLDAIAGTSDYELDVSVIDVSLPVEKEINVFLNNPSTQGMWDTDALFKLLEDTEVNFEQMGFSVLDLECLIGADRVKDVLGRNSIFDVGESGELAAEAAEQDTARKDREAEKAAKAAAEEARKQTPEYIEAAKQEKHRGGQGSDAHDFYAVLVFKDATGRQALAAALSEDPSLKYFDGARVLSLMGVELEQKEVDSGDEST